VRNNSPLRFNVTLALRDMTLRHFQGGLAVHCNCCTPNAGPWRTMFRLGRLVHSQPALRGG
jgi:hypothetical protein